MENNRAKNPAEQIAHLLQKNEKEADDFTFLRANLEKINERLDDIESSIAFQTPNSKLQTLKSNHPSREKFAVLEAIADDMFERYETEKSCPYEPTGKLCDHCSMCNSRGF
ncbi:MAG TPA: hypothetical protein VNI84_16100 [Pyrinomonadaceae bacterium]|nr:hypothetical protein [Pyrinomonadaceae bacterium]